MASSVIDVPLLDHRLASTAMRALQVDAELSPLVRRSFSLVEVDAANGNVVEETGSGFHETILRTEYRATTNRMLRVAVNGFMESLGVVLQVMEELDVDVLQSRSSCPLPKIRPAAQSTSDKDFASLSRQQAEPVSDRR